MVELSTFCWHLFSFFLYNMKKITLITALFCSIILVWCSFTKKTDNDDTVNTDSNTIQWSTTNDTTTAENNNIRFFNDTTNNSQVNPWTDQTTSTTTPADIKGKYSFDDENCNKYVKLMECLIDKTPEAAKNQTADSFKKVMELWSWLEKTVLPSTCKNTIDMLTNQKDVFEKVGCTIK